jgi:hypothetical protein
MTQRIVLAYTAFGYRLAIISLNFSVLSTGKFPSKNASFLTITLLAACRNATENWWLPSSRVRIWHTGLYPVR